MFNVWVISPSWELRTASPRGLKHIYIKCLKHIYIKTALVGRRQPMTSLPARPQYKGRRENTSFSSSSFVWARSMHAMSLRGNLRALWLFFYEKSPLSSVPLFEEREAAVCFPRFGTHRCRGTEANEIMGFAVGYGRWVREGLPLFVRIGREREWAAGMWWFNLSDIIRFSG